MSPTEIIAALDLTRAPSDAVRAQLLHALVQYGQAVGDAALADAARAAKPAVDPFKPPQEWKAFYLDTFSSTADPDCSVDPDEGPRYCVEYWQSLTDAQRAERLACPNLGRQDGIDDAEALNEA